MSTAETAIAPAPGCPAFRRARRISTQTVGGRMASAPLTTSRSFDSTSVLTDRSPYVYPMPCSRPLKASTTIAVVESHSRVPSDSGWSVGTS